MDIQTWVKLNVGCTEHTGDRPMDIQTYRHELNLM